MPAQLASSDRGYVRVSAAPCLSFQCAPLGQHALWVSVIVGHIQELSHQALYVPQLKHYQRTRGP